LRQKPYFRLPGLAAALALSGCAGVLDLDGALAIAPYHIEDSGRIVVEGHVNEQGPFDFALDTGSSITAVFDELRDELALEPIPGIKVIVHGAVTSGQFPLLDIDRLTVGREIWADPRIVSLPGETAAGATIDGILGVDFLRRYAVGFSTKDRVVRLFPPDLVADRAYQGWASVPLEAEAIGESGAALYFIDIEIDGRKISALFDLGAGFNMINWPGATGRVRDSSVSPGRDYVMKIWCRVPSRNHRLPHGSTRGKSLQRVSVGETRCFRSPIWKSSTP
jgi:hypothetical protein